VKVSQRESVNQPIGIAKLLFCFSRKSNQHIRSQGSVGEDAVKLHDPFGILVRSIGAAHPFQDGGIAALQRNMEMGTDPIPVRKMLYERFAPFHGFQ